MRKSPTFHAETRLPKRFGAGNLLALVHRQTLAREQPKSCVTSFKRTCAESGKLSNLVSAGVIPEDVLTGCRR